VEVDGDRDGSGLDGLRMDGTCCLVYLFSSSVLVGMR
jgi:hypothetical protein